jgi:hypothetical protein
MVISFLSFISFQQVIAIGMMTEPIVIKDILRGQETFATLNLLNSENREVIYGLAAEGQIAGWVSFYTIEDADLESPITKINMPSAKFTDVKMKISVPNDMPNGTYTGEVLAFLASSGELIEGQTTVNVSQQVSRKVTVIVTDKEILQFKAAFIPATYDVQPGKALKIRVLYDNQGNIAVKPDLQLKIIKDGATLYNAIFPYPDNEEAVRAYATKEIPPIEWQTIGQTNGNYKAELTVSLNGAEIQKESFSFSIGYSGFGFLAALSFLGNNGLNSPWTLLSIMFIVLAIVLVVLDRKKVNFQKARSAFGNFRKLF